MLAISSCALLLLTLHKVNVHVQHQVCGFSLDSMHLFLPSFMAPSVAPTVDAKYGCGSDGAHVSRPANAAELLTAFDDPIVTCIKLAAGTVYSLSTWLYIRRMAAIVAEEGAATLDGEGATNILDVVGAAADVTLLNVVLRNGKGYVDGNGKVRSSGPSRRVGPAERRRARVAGGAPLVPT